MVLDTMSVSINTTVHNLTTSQTTATLPVSTLSDNLTTSTPSIMDFLSTLELQCRPQTSPGKLEPGTTDALQAMDDHKIEITEQGVGTVQVKGTFEVKEDKSLENAGWTEVFSKPMKVYHQIIGTKYQETIDKETTLWVKSKATLLNQMFYEKKSRTKAIKAIINLDREAVIGAVEKTYPHIISDANLSKPYDIEKLGNALSDLSAKELEKLVMPLQLGDTKVMELEIDGNYYLASGFGKKILDGKKIWDDTQPSDDVWAPPEKVNWSIAALSFNVVDTQKGFQITIATYAIIAIFVLLFTFLNTKERVNPPVDQEVDVKRDLRLVLTNRNWLVVSVMSLFTLGFVCIYGAAIMYYFKYYVGSLGLAAAFLGIGTATNFIGALSTPFLTKLAGSKKRLYFISAMLMTAIYFLYYLPTPESIVFLFLLSGFGGFFSGPLSPVIWAMYADIADHVEWKGKVRATGLVFSAASFAQKSGWALGGAVTGWLLSWWGFEAHIEQSADTIFGIKSLISWIPAGCATIAASIVLLYQLDDKTMETIEKDLKIRRAEAATKEA